jgi:putative hemolysin
MSLFLLWKGLLTVLLQNPDYRYLIGPVSISNDFSEFSKSIIVQFIKKNHYDPELAKFLKSRKRFAYRNSKSIDTEIIIDNANNDIRKVEKVISDVDPGFRIPVLLKKYLEVNGRIIGFNVDPNFNGCLDGLIMCDIYKFPLEYVKALSKEMQDDTILDRFAENPGRDIIKSSPC